jgi:glutaredoxin-dependent peroxiredoxin
MSLTIGQRAPEFNLPDQDKKFHTLSEYRGKNVVLFFFPAAWTGACTKEMCAIQENFNAYASLNAVPIGISVDTIFAQKRFKEDYKLDNIILLSDFNKDTIKAYDVVNNNFSVGYNGVAMRSTFVVDKEGVLRYIQILKAQGDQPDFEAIQNAVKALN